MKKLVIYHFFYCFFAMNGLFSEKTLSKIELDHTHKNLHTLLNSHCYECHDDEVQKGDLNLLDLEFNPLSKENFSIWHDVFDRVKHGDMPPKKKKQPNVKSKQFFLNELSNSLLKSDQYLKTHHSPFHTRRLTRLEYEYTIRDLIGVDIPLKELFPTDSSSHGFDTISSQQKTSHVHIETYIDVADRILTEAFQRLKNGDIRFKRDFTATDLTYKNKFGFYQGPQYKNQKSITWMSKNLFYGRMQKTTVPETGWYKVTLKNVEALNPKKGSVWATLISGICNANAPTKHLLGLVEATASKQDLSFTAWIKKGHMLQLKPEDVTLKQVDLKRKGNHFSLVTKDYQREGYPGIAITGLRIERTHPFGNQQTLKKKLLGSRSLESIHAIKTHHQKINLLKLMVKDFAYKAFRSPLTNEQLQPYLDLCLKNANPKKFNFLDSLKFAYHSILCSPRFLTLPESVHELNDYQIASRLSYAIWKSMPDAELIEAAEQGKLKTEQGLYKQTERLLNHHKSKRFFNDFTDQWLNLKEINATSPDQRFQTKYDPIVHESLLKETRAFFRECIQKDLSVTNIIQANFGMLNERLIRYYGLNKDALDQCTPGEGIQRVQIKNRSRGGLITQAAVLKVTANGSNTSPITRGVWISQRILGINIPEPPNNIPAIEPDIRGATSIREQLGKHREMDACASCHKKIDPAGLVLENFDPIGLWRNKYHPYPDAPNIDASGKTDLGKSFKNIYEWKQIYRHQPEQLALNFTKQFLTYAKGLELSFSDQHKINDLLEKIKEQNYGMRSILHAVIQSHLFQTKYNHHDN